MDGSIIYDILTYAIKNERAINEVISMLQNLRNENRTQHEQLYDCMRRHQQVSKEELDAAITDLRRGIARISDALFEQNAALSLILEQNRLLDAQNELLIAALPTKPSTNTSDPSNPLQ